ncbi:DUF2147 domain-containing protein [Flavobacterium agricola]|uniref:DUF2147 domain-containing protein n=1 Tax=Flavobacterium agricola TaxID=2870839 RepID=A0ABY6M3X6_9FLAO|nr:DUF2147 domain-containing protein [Flavobacterium agricola]UYW02173.1 DUF2147 domain-containing protein [Flavobacterium agricola]
MKKLLVTLTFAVACTAVGFAQSVAGKWKTFDDKTGEAKSIVEITEVNGKLQGKIIEVLNPAKKNNVCTECKGADKGKKLEGLTIIKNMDKDGAEYSGGKILDPTNGKEYSCIIKLNKDNADKLDVRGYIGMSFAGRTQYWTRVK